MRVPSTHPRGAIVPITMPKKIVLTSLLLAAAVILITTSGCSGTPTMRLQKGGKPSVFSLFNLKSKSKFWSESIIRPDFEDLESTVSPGSWKESLSNFTKSGNIGTYMKLAEIESLYLPVPVNFIFAGFGGKGNHEFKLGPEELERWFSKIDHIFEHTRIPRMGEVLTPFYKISVDKAQSHYLPLVSHIHYNFSVHAIQLGETVTSVFEQAIKVLSRKEEISNSSDSENIVWQVDIGGMDSLFSSLVEYLQLDNAYNIFILNPKRVIGTGLYGYRRGLSESEITFLKENVAIRDKILKSERKAANFLDIPKSERRRPLYSIHPLQKFAWTAAENHHMEDWSKACLEALQVAEKKYQDKDEAEVISTKVSQMLNAKNDVKDSLEKGLKSGEFAGLHPECLTDSWIGNERWAFVDLTAGPFSWGPAVGGEGVRTEVSLPNVERTVGALAEITEDEAEDRLQEIIRERFSVSGDDHQAIDILLAEIDIYELFAFKHCKGRRVKLALCEELDERMHDLKNELEAYDGSKEHDESHKKKAFDALRRMENWNLFSDVYEQEPQEYTVARDSFLAQLGSSLWGSMRHVIAPSTSHGAYHYYEKISFQLFVITQEKSRNIRALPVNLAALKEGLASLLVPSQKIMFSESRLALSEDSALAMAFSVARRAAAVPVLLVNGTYRSTVRTYLDSSILQHQLQKLSNHGSLKGMHASMRSTLEVPIFWFLHDEPLFVDKHYQARALSNMVIVVQSESPSWESHLQCNGQSLLWDLRNPIKASISVTAEHLAGLIPLHLVYSHAHETAIEDWIWSVGCNPFSITSQGWHVSQFQTDTIARSYIITSIEESVLEVNAAIYRLLKESATAQGFGIFKSRERELVDKYNYIVSLWKRISTMSGDLRYGEAMKLLALLEEASKGYSVAVNTIISLLHPIHCTREQKVSVELDATTIPAFLVVFAVLWFVVRPRRPKAKIN